MMVGPGVSLNCLRECKHFHLHPISWMLCIPEHLVNSLLLVIYAPAQLTTSWDFRGWAQRRIGWRVLGASWAEGREGELGAVVCLCLLS